jgi:hypothetical protein
VYHHAQLLVEVATFLNEECQPFYTSVARLDRIRKQCLKQQAQLGDSELFLQTFQESNLLFVFGTHLPSPLKGAMHGC